MQSILLRNFQLTIRRHYIKPVAQDLASKINKNYVSEKYAGALEKFHESGRILFNTVLEIQKVRIRKMDRITTAKERRRIRNEKIVEDPLPTVLNQLCEDPVLLRDVNIQEVGKEKLRRYQKTVLPFSRYLRIDSEEQNEILNQVEDEQPKRLIPKNWLQDYDLYDETAEEINVYGTPDVLYPISNVPCHGCGALLHCKE